MNSDGTGKSYKNGSTCDVKWNLDGDNFTMTEVVLGMSASDARQTHTSIEIDYTGTLKDGKLTIYDGDSLKDNTREYYYVKK